MGILKFFSTKSTVVGIVCDWLKKIVSEFSTIPLYMKYCNDFAIDDDEYVKNEFIILTLAL